MKFFISIILLNCLSSLGALKYTSKNGLLPPKASCGLQLSGNDANKYPWVVYIPVSYRIPVPGANLRCAGVLISKRYFIMSKYCLQYFMEKVYLGLYDSSQNITCGVGGCKPVEEVYVDKWVADELEIALVRLERDVEFSEFVQPICLPFDDYTKAQPGDTVYSSGWGLVQPGGPYSEIKKKIEQTLLTNDDCADSSVTKKSENERLICTEVELNEISDIPCKGDDGTPIMYETPEKQWVLQGILPWLPQCVMGGSVTGARINEEAIAFILKYMYE